MSTERLPCGCVMGDAPLPDGTSAFLYQPCSPTCEYYLYTQQAAAKMNKPMRVMNFCGEAVDVGRLLCPACSTDLGKVQDMSGGGATPSPGDWSICAVCAALLVFGEGLVLRVPTEAEMAVAPPELNVMQNRLMERHR